MQGAVPPAVPAVFPTAPLRPPGEWERNSDVSAAKDLAEKKCKKARGLPCRDLFSTRARPGFRAAQRARGHLCKTLQVLAIQGRPEGRGSAMTQQPGAGRPTARARRPIGGQGDSRPVQSTPVTTRLADIAAQAGVSEATVSRVLNGKPGVAAPTR